METNMPAIKKTSHHPDFHKLDTERREMRDNNACAVIALCAVTGAPYKQVYDLLAKHGRKHGKGTYWNAENKVLADLGFKRTRVHLDQLIAKYPLPHCNVLKNVTTHHPRRFPGCFPAGKLLAWTRGHILAIVDGEVLDWTVNSPCRITSMDIITPIEPAKSWDEQDAETFKK
jgi:hypothetical protein